VAAHIWLVFIPYQSDRNIHKGCISRPIFYRAIVFFFCQVA
jgi:hypothetical protein